MYEHETRDLHSDVWESAAIQPLYCTQRTVKVISFRLHMKNVLKYFIHKKERMLAYNLLPCVTT